MAAKPKSAAGRPTAYRSEYADKARKLCLLGATDGEIADIIGVSEVTLNAWKQKFPKFLKSLAEGKADADANVADRLYQRALGYSHKAVKIFNSDGQPLVVPYVEHYPPDTAAASLWLRNRQPKKWRDKTDHEHTGPGGGPLIPVLNVFSTASPARPEPAPEADRSATDPSD